MADYLSGANPYAATRMRSIFSSPGDVGIRLPKRFVSGQTNTFNPQQKPPEDEDDSLSYYRDLEKLRGQLKAAPARSAYMEALTHQPTDAQTAPSRGRRIGAAIAGGLGGFAEGPSRGAALAQGIIDAPYKSAMQDYTTKLAGLGESAKLEQDDIETQMKTLEAARRMGLEYRKFDAERFDKNRNYSLDREKFGELAGYHQGTLKNAAQANADTKWYRGQQLGIQEYNALTTREKARADVETNQRNATSNETRAEAYKTAAGNRGNTPPTQQRAGVDNALREMYRDPNFSQFITKDKTTGLYDYADAKPEWANSLMYKEFQKRMRSVMEGSKKSGISLFPDDGQDDDDSIIIGAPTPFGRR